MSKTIKRLIYQVRDELCSFERKIPEKRGLAILFVSIVISGLLSGPLAFAAVVLVDQSIGLILPTVSESKNALEDDANLTRQKEGLIKYGLCCDRLPFGLINRKPLYCDFIPDWDVKSKTICNQKNFF